jgi:hypothetical protein
MDDIIIDETNLNEIEKGIINYLKYRIKDCYNHMYYWNDCFKEYPQAVQFITQALKIYTTITTLIFQLYISGRKFSSDATLIRIIQNKYSNYSIGFTKKLIWRK